MKHAPAMSRTSKLRSRPHDNGILRRLFIANLLVLSCLHLHRSRKLPAFVGQAVGLPLRRSQTKHIVDIPRASLRRRNVQMHANADNFNAAPLMKLLVLGGAGYVGREVCRLAVKQGYDVVSLSRRGTNPEPADKLLSSVRWVKGDATDMDVVQPLVAETDAAVHAIGLLFDVNSGLAGLSPIVSGSRSTPGKDSTYDNITRKTAFNLVEAIQMKPNRVVSQRFPVLFVSAAEAGWPQVRGGEQIEAIAPQFMREYLAAKRAVEAKLEASVDDIRPVMYRPSLIWSWDKFDVLPVIPLFNIASALGVPFVDKTVTVTTLAKAIVEGLRDEKVEGVKRSPDMEALAQNIL